jgi:hypothetical protein
MDAVELSFYLFILDYIAKVVEFLLIMSTIKEKENYLAP